MRSLGASWVRRVLREALVRAEKRMNPEQIEERFERIEGLLMQTVEFSMRSQREYAQRMAAFDERLAASQRQIEENNQAIAALTHDFRSGVEDLVEFGMQTLNAVEENSNHIRVMQSEVTGLQVENRRILRELRERRE